MSGAYAATTDTSSDHRPGDRQIRVQGGVRLRALEIEISPNPVNIELKDHCRYFWYSKRIKGKEYIVVIACVAF